MESIKICLLQEFSRSHVELMFCVVTWQLSVLLVVSAHSAQSLETRQAYNKVLRIKYKSSVNFQLVKSFQFLFSIKKRVKDSKMLFSTDGCFYSHRSDWLTIWIFFLSHNSRYLCRNWKVKLYYRVKLRTMIDYCSLGLTTVLAFFCR